MSVSKVSSENKKKDIIAMQNEDSLRIRGKNDDLAKKEKNVRNKHRLIGFILIALSIMLTRIVIILLLLYMLG